MAKKQKSYTNEFKQQKWSLYIKKAAKSPLNCPTNMAYRKVLFTNGLGFFHLSKALTKIFRSKTTKLCKNRLKNLKAPSYFS